MKNTTKTKTKTNTQNLDVPDRTLVACKVKLSSCKFPTHYHLRPKSGFARRKAEQKAKRPARPCKYGLKCNRPEHHHPVSQMERKYGEEVDGIMDKWKHLRVKTHPSAPPLEVLDTMHDEESLSSPSVSSPPAMESDGEEDESSAPSSIPPPPSSPPSSSVSLISCSSDVTGATSTDDDEPDPPCSGPGQGRVVWVFITERDEVQSTSVTCCKTPTCYGVFRCGTKVITFEGNHPDAILVDSYLAHPARDGGVSESLNLKQARGKRRMWCGLSCTKKNQRQTAYPLHLYYKHAFKAVVDGGAVDRLLDAGANPPNYVTDLLNLPAIRPGGEINPSLAQAVSFCIGELRWQFVDIATRDYTQMYITNRLILRWCYLRAATDVNGNGRMLNSLWAPSGPPAPGGAHSGSSP